MKETILIVGEDEALSSTRAALLREWQVVTTLCEGAAAAILGRRYDLLILCQTVPKEAAIKIIATARATHPSVRVLAVSREGEDRRFDSERYEVQLNNPRGLRDAAARLLSPSTVECG
jgi:DNA-binding response OmpR family regulator